MNTQDRARHTLITAGYITAVTVLLLASWTAVCLCIIGLFWALVIVMVL